MTPRVRATLENRWVVAGRPDTGFVWPGDTSAGYIHDETIRRAHLKAVEAAKIRHFVLYSIRHTFLTRLGESGCDAWTLARIAGHNSIKISSRYAHPSEDAVSAAMSKLPVPAALPAGPISGVADFVAGTGLDGLGWNSHLQTKSKTYKPGQPWPNGSNSPS